MYRCNQDCYFNKNGSLWKEGSQSLHGCLWDNGPDCLSQRCVRARFATSWKTSRRLAGACGSVALTRAPQSDMGVRRAICLVWAARRRDIIQSFCTDVWVHVWPSFWPNWRPFCSPIRARKKGNFSMLCMNHLYCRQIGQYAKLAYPR